MSRAARSEVLVPIAPSSRLSRGVAAALVLFAVALGSGDAGAVDPAPVVRATGPARPVYTGAKWGLRFVPDGRINFVTDRNGAATVWWASGTAAGAGHTVATRTRDFLDFVPLTLSGGAAVGGLGPAGGATAFDADYAGPGSILPDPASADPRRLIMFYHGENHTYSGRRRDDAYHAGIGIARSSDGGRTWVRGGRILDGMIRHPAEPPRSATGAGMPSVVVADGWFHLFYVDWNTTLPDVIHHARAPLSGGGRPGTWRKWYDGGFGEPGLGGRSTPVVLPPRPASIYAGMPSVGWNTALGRWLMVFESDDAFWAVASRDLATWSAAAPILANPAGAASRRTGAVWMSYATPITPGAPSDRITGASAWLYLARGVWGVVDHTLWRVPIVIRPSATGH